MVLAVVLCLAFTLVLLAGFAVGVAGRMRFTGGRFPQAIQIPIVVNFGLSALTALFARETGTPATRLSESTYACAAVDSAGLHVIQSLQRDPGLIPAALVTHVGIGRTSVGWRRMNAIVVTVTAPSGPIELPFVPMRVWDNPLRALSDEELGDLVTQIQGALAGHQPTMTTWPY
jgi:hypothetical protein